MPGLTSTSTCVETHLYHATLDPVIVYTPADAAKYKAMGYQEEYIPRYAPAPDKEPQ